MEHVARLSDEGMAGREAATKGEWAAAAYVTGELLRAGLTPSLQAVPYGVGSQNVLALLRGHDDAELIVVGAHLDHLGVRNGKLYPGADDDASGVALVLGIARELAARRSELGRSVLFVWFGAEEPGMVGSSFFVQNPPLALSRIAAMINVDMIGRPLVDQFPYRPLATLVGIQGDAVGLVGARRYPRLRALADAEFQADGAEIVAAEDLPSAIGEEVERQTRGRGDSVPFAERGIPTLFFGDGESSDYHQPTDTIEELDPGLLERRAHALARLVIRLSQAPTSDFAPSDAPAPKRKPERGFYLPIGAWTGLSLHPNPAYFLGGELSFVHFWNESLVSLGGYADALYDFGRDDVRLTIGPEIGKGLFGIDAGYAIELERAGAVRHGAVVRPYASVSYLTLGARLGYFQGSGWLGELGLLMKLPIPVATSSLP